MAVLGEANRDEQILERAAKFQSPPARAIFPHSCSSIVFSSRPTPLHFLLFLVSPESSDDVSSQEGVWSKHAECGEMLT